MPAGSSTKRERQYEHIKESYQDKGVSAGEEGARGPYRQQGAPRVRGRQRRKTLFADSAPMRRLLRGAGREIVWDEIDAGVEEIALAV